MYLAELRGKLSSRVERMEDILTSNVFSFFKYTNREVFLRGYLKQLGLDVSSQEAKDAEFLFWPVYEDGTEPDLVIIVGKYYLLIEAKYFSEFGGETETTLAQLTREVQNGQFEAANYAKMFKLIAITADYYYKKEKFTVLPSNSSSYLIWTNWQSVASLLNRTLETHGNLPDEVKVFARDLYDLLDKKNLRGFQAIIIPPNKRLLMKEYTSVFLEAATASFRGAFVGFVESLSSQGRILPRKQVFFDRHNTTLA